VPVNVGGDVTAPPAADGVGVAMETGGLVMGV
jgi:hypothetical protein